MQSVTHEENQTQNSLLKIHENSISLYLIYCLTWSLNETYWFKKNNPTLTPAQKIKEKKTHPCIYTGENCVI